MLSPHMVSFEGLTYVPGQPHLYALWQHVYIFVTCSSCIQFRRW